MKVDRLIVLEQLPGIPAPWVVDHRMPESDNLYTGPCPTGTADWETSDETILLYDEDGELLLRLSNVPYVIQPYEIPDPVEEDEDEDPDETTDEHATHKEVGFGYNHGDPYAWAKIFGIAVVIALVFAVGYIAFKAATGGHS